MNCIGGVIVSGHAHVWQPEPRTCEDLYGLSGMLGHPFGSLILGSQAEVRWISDYTLEGGLVDYLRSNPKIYCFAGGRIYPQAVDRKNQVWPVIVYGISKEHQHVLSGSAGWAWADVSIDVLSPVYGQVLQLSDALRLSLQGFRGWWAAVQIGAVILESDDDGVERPSDGSGTWYYRRSFDYRVMFAEQVPQF